MIQQPTSAPPPRTRNTVVDLIRAIGIALVIGSHYFVFAELAGAPAGPLGRAIGYLFRHGYYGVTIFFVVSGFLITGTSVRPHSSDPARHLTIDARKFYIRRATRILPLLFAILLIGAAFLLTLSDGTPRTEFVFRARDAVFDPPFWISILLFVFNWLRIARSAVADGWGLHWDVLWSLAVEEQFYVLFPALILICARLHRVRVVLSAAVLVSLLTRAWLLHTGADRLAVFSNTLCCIDSLALGALAALAKPPAPGAARLYGWGGILLSAVGFALSDYQAWGIGATLLSAGIAALLQWSRSFKAGGSRVLAAPARFGQLSYGLYLLHPMILFLTAPLLLRLNQPVAIVIYFAACFLAAQLSFSLFESPVERGLRQRFIGSPQIRLATPLQFTE